MRISDWSSDVCSSDLCRGVPGPCPDAVDDRAGQRAVRRAVALAGMAEGTGGGPCAQIHRYGRARGCGSEKALAAFGWHEAARRHCPRAQHRAEDARSEENTSELQSLMRISYAVFCSKKQKQQN